MLDIFQTLYSLEINLSLNEINNFFDGEASKLMNKLNRESENNGI